LGWVYNTGSASLLGKSPEGFHKVARDPERRVGKRLIGAGGERHEQRDGLRGTGQGRDREMEREKRDQRRESCATKRSKLYRSQNLFNGRACNRGRDVSSHNKGIHTQEQPAVVTLM
jgi:hypothetical protein